MNFRVKRSFIPMQSVVRIDEVEKEGAGKISECRLSVAMFVPFHFRQWLAKPVKDNILKCMVQR